MLGVLAAVSFFLVGSAEAQGEPDPNLVSLCRGMFRVRFLDSAFT
jgi:hypothetical protein